MKFRWESDRLVFGITLQKYNVTTLEQPHQQHSNARKELKGKASCTAHDDADVVVVAVRRVPRQMARWGEERRVNIGKACFPRHEHNQTSQHGTIIEE